VFEGGGACREDLVDRCESDGACGGIDVNCCPNDCALCDGALCEAAEAMLEDAPAAVAASSEIAALSST